MTDYIIGGEILKKRKLVTIDGSMVTTETGIPLALNIVLPNVKAAGADVRLAELDGTPIAREIECVNVPSTDAVMLHYPFDTTTGENSQFYVYWGNASLSEPAADSTYGSEAVWDGSTLAAYLLNQEPNGAGSGGVIDSAGNYHATPTGFTVNSLSNDAYGTGVHFDGAGDWLDIGPSIPNTGDMTFTSVVTFDAVSKDQALIALVTGDVYWVDLISTNKFRNVNLAAANLETSETYSASTRYVVSNQFDYTNDVWKIFVNGEQKASAALTGSPASRAYQNGIGQQNGGEYLDGVMSYASIDSVARSDDWLMTQGKNLNNPTASGTDPFYLSRYDDSQTYSAKSDSGGTKSTFLRRTSITRNHTGALTDYQQSYTIPYHALMNTDFSDFRFNTQADGNGDYLPYWIESQTDSDTADVWVKSDYASGDDIIYMFYGNDALTSESSGSDVFELFDDFESYADTAAMVAVWAVNYGIPTLEGTTVYEGAQGISIVPLSWAERNLPITSDFEVVVWGRYSQTTDDYGLMIMESDNDVVILMEGGYPTAGNWGRLIDEGADTNTGVAMGALNTWHKMTLRLCNSKISFWEDSTHILDEVSYTYTPYKILLGRENTYQDLIYIRKCIATEPTYTIGTTTAPDKFSAVSDSDGNVSVFERRKPVKLTHSGVLTDYQYFETFDYEASMLDNFDDIRFVTQSGEHIPYWIETKTDGVSAKVWFMNDYVDGDTYIWMYYGNDALTSESNSSDTFIQWHGAATANYIDSLVVSPSNIVYETKIKRTAATHNIQFGVFNTQTQTDDYFSLITYSAGNNIHVKSGNEGAYTALSEEPALSIGTYYRGKMTFDGTTLYGHFDDNEISSGGVSTNIPNESLGLALWITNGACVQDWSFVRKYTATEPTVTVGAEQHPRIRNIMIL